MQPGSHHTTSGSPPALVTRALTIMFTDMKGFTSRTSAQSRLEIGAMLTIHDKKLRPVFVRFGGRIIKTIGDAFLVVFDSPTDAVLCGISIQRVVAHHNAQVPQAHRFYVRVAINSGEVHLKDNDIFGEPVNIAARIEGIAEAGQVWFSEAVYLAMNKNEIRSEPMGEHILKGIPYPVKLYRVAVPKHRTILHSLSHHLSHFTKKTHKSHSAPQKGTSPTFHESGQTIAVHLPSRHHTVQKPPPINITHMLTVFGFIALLVYIEATYPGYLHYYYKTIVEPAFDFISQILQILFNSLTTNA